MIQVGDRKSAIAKGELKYYTGNLCKNGHRSQRYVRNGACIECLRVNNAIISQAIALAPNERRTAIQSLVKMGMRIYHVDYPKFAELAVAMTQARHPVLSHANVVGNGKCTGDAAGTGFYPFLVHPDDVQMLRDVAQAYCSEKIKDMVHPFAERLAEQARLATQERTQSIGEWSFK